MLMKSALILFIASIGAVGCSSTHVSRAPSSLPGSRTFLGKGASITLKQPVPFINTESSQQTVQVTGRKSFMQDGNKFLCSLSAQVPKQNTFLFDEGTVFYFKEQSAEGLNNFTPSKKGAPVNLSCYNSVTGEKKSSLTLEEVRLAFPPDVLVIEPSSIGDSDIPHKNNPTNDIVNRPKRGERKNFPL
jgi:hypothetical protein